MCSLLYIIHVQFINVTFILKYILRRKEQETKGEIKFLELKTGINDRPTLIMTAKSGI